VAGRFIALCALVRCALVAAHIAAAVWRGAAAPYDAMFVDQVAGVLPVLRLLLPRTRLLFYCHFPDLLLSTQRASLLKRAYRAPLDWLEETATGECGAWR
jgi:alpha-1,3/alpha-1,6-mannosyltransferase